MFKEHTAYKIMINSNHPPAVRFVTLVHELAHLFLGHLCADKKLRIPQKRELSERQRELEAESVAYMVSRRRGILSKSQRHLSDCVGSDTTVDDLDLYAVMRAAGQVEAILGIAADRNFVQR